MMYLLRSFLVLSPTWISSYPCAQPLLNTYSNYKYSVIPVINLTHYLIHSTCSPQSQVSSLNNTMIATKLHFRIYRMTHTLTTWCSQDFWFPLALLWSFSLFFFLCWVYILNFKAAWKLLLVLLLPFYLWCWSLQPTIPESKFNYNKVTKVFILY